MKIEFSPPDISDLEIEEVVDTLKSGWLTTGPKTKELERRIADYVGVKKAVCLIQWVQQSVSVITMIVGVYLVVSNNLSMGALIAVSMLFSRCIAPVGRAAGLLMQYNTASRSLV